MFQSGPKRRKHFNKELDHFSPPPPSLEHFRTLLNTFGKKSFSEAEDTYDIGDFEGVFNLWEQLFPNFSKSV